MSTILDQLKPGPKPKPIIDPPKAPPIAAQLQDASAALAAEQAKYDAIAFAATEGEEGKRTLAELDRSLASHRSKVAALEAAHRGALAHDRKLDLVRKADRINEGFAGLTRRLNERHKAALAYADAIAAADKAFKTLIDKTDAAIQCWPKEIPSPWHGSVDHTGDLVRLAKQEMWRVSATGKLGDPRILPGADPVSLLFRHSAGGLMPIEKSIAGANEAVLTQVAKAKAQIEGKA